MTSTIPDLAGSGDQRARRRRVALIAGTVTSITLLALALVFSSSFAAGRVAANARALHWTNATLGALAISRASNAQAVVFAVDADLGVATPAAAGAALDEARLNLDDAEKWLSGAGDAVGADALELQRRAEAAIEEARLVLDGIESGDLEPAVARNGGSFEAAYQEARRAFAAEQDAISEQIDATERLAGLLSGVIRFAVTLLIPAIALIAYRFIVRRQLERRKVEMDAKLEAERALSRSRDEFIANISHEIRTPLTTIFGFSEVLLEGAYEDPETAHELLTFINDESTELSRMVEDLLTAARIDAEALEFNIEDVVVGGEIEAVLAPLRRAGIAVEVDVPHVVLEADRLRFRQILRNLVSNAHKHGGGRIRIEGRAFGDRFLCRVEDDGPGVPAEMEERLFQRFVHKGTEPLLAGSVGLGLAIAYSLAASMQGSLEYRRADGWTRFELDLPLATGAVGPTPSPEVLLSHGRNRIPVEPPAGLDIAASRVRGEEPAGPQW